MTKAPRRPVSQPDGGGALSWMRPRAGNGQFVKRSESVAPTPEEPAPLEVVKRKRAASPEQLVGRVTRAIERELSQIEDIIGGTPAEGDKRARTLASLARTLAEVTRLRSAQNDAKVENDDDAVPRSLDEFRQELERRLARMVDPPEVVPDRGDEPA